MTKQQIVLAMCCSLMIAVGGCSRQQSDWQKARESNTTDSYELFLKKYPAGEFTGQAEARLRTLYEERDWQKARDADTPEAYQAFLKQYPDGKWTEEARIRVENFTLAQAPSAPAGSAPSEAGGSPAAAPAGGGATGMETSAGTAPAPVKNQSPPSTAAVRSGGGGASNGGSTSSGSGVSNGGSTSSGSGALSAGGSYGIQLGAFKSGADAAQKHWAQLQKQYPSMLSGLTSQVVPKTTAAGKLYRLQSTGLSEKRARSICDSLKSKSQDCVVLPAA